MHRRELLKQSAWGAIAALPLPLLGAACRQTSVAKASGTQSDPEAPARPLKRPANGEAIRTAVLISDGAVVIDFAGPWEVFSGAMPGGRMDVPTFKLYMVSESAKPVKAGGGMTIIPDYTLVNAPQPHVIVIPAQSNDSPAVLEWIRHASATADLTMSVCTGAFILAKTGLLDGKSATTHHGAYGDLAQAYPRVRVQRGVRYVEDGNLATSGGLSCGIDLALRVVERYYGRQTASESASNLEYQSDGWLRPSASHVYADTRPSDTGSIDRI